MDILENIENYVLLSADAKKLIADINEYKRSEFYAKVEGDLSYSEGDYSSEKQYNKSVRINQDMRAKTEEKLKTVSQSLEAEKAKIKAELGSISKTDLKEVVNKVSSKVKELEGYVARLRREIKIAYENGDKAYMIGDFKKEKEYNSEYRRLYSEINELNPIVETYGEVLLFLNDGALENNNASELGE